MKIIFALLIASICLHSVSAQTPTQRPTSDEFRRMHSFIAGAGVAMTLPGNLSQLLGWSSGEPVKSMRKSYTERKDGVRVRRYAADVIAGRHNIILISQLEEGDTMVNWLFDNHGNIVRVTELFPNRNWDVEEVSNGVYDELGYQSFRIIMNRIDGKTP